MRSSKSRSRSKSNRNRPTGSNVVNRVFDSSGPEGKVRGTPQQIIEKYNQLARDAQLANDRVAAENFQQHAEHYLRMLSEAQREIDARREEQERHNRERQAERDRERQDREPTGGGETPSEPSQAQLPQPPFQPHAQPKSGSSADVVDLGEAEHGGTGLVDTPEGGSKPSSRKPRARKPATEGETAKPASSKPATPKSGSSKSGSSSRSRKPKPPSEGGGGTDGGSNGGPAEAAE